MRNVEYRLLVTIKIHDPEEEGVEPIDHVVDAVEQLLNDNADEWLLEAIGHPHPGGFEIVVAPANGVGGDGGWQPINTAPMEAPKVLVSTPGQHKTHPYPVTARWSGLWVFATNDYMDGVPFNPQPTHWKPLPEDD